MSTLHAMRTRAVIGILVGCFAIAAVTPCPPSPTMLRVALHGVQSGTSSPVSRPHAPSLRLALTHPHGSSPRMHPGGFPPPGIPEAAATAHPDPESQDARHTGAAARALAPTNAEVLAAPCPCGCGKRPRAGGAGHLDVALLAAPWDLPPTSRWGPLLDRLFQPPTGASPGPDHVPLPTHPA